MYSYGNTLIDRQLGVNNVRQVSPRAETVPVFRAGSPETDTVNLRSKKEIYIDKLNKLFPDGGIQKVYDKINQDFGLDRPAHLRFVTDNEGVAAGGFTFAKNEIVLSMSDMLDSDAKVVGIKNGKKVVLTSPKNKLPLIADKNSAEKFVEQYSKFGNLGFDQLVVEPVTEEDQRKLIIQKIVHEVVHAQQHMILRQTEGIGEKEIFKAWTHEKPKNLIESALLDLKVNSQRGQSYWADEPDTEKTVPANSPKGALAKIWLEAIRNYPPYDSPEYERNAIEVDAYERSAQYVKNNYGGWQG